VLVVLVVIKRIGESLSASKHNNFHPPSQAISMSNPPTLENHLRSQTAIKAQRRKTAPFGVKIVIGFLIYHLLLIVLPAWSYFQYDLVATALHLEEPRQLADEAVVETNRAIGLTNLIYVIPMNIMSIIGLCCHYTCCCCCCGSSSSHDTTTLPPIWVMTSTTMVLSIAIYWPILYISSRFTYASANIDHVPLHTTDVITLMVELCFAAWSIWYLSSFCSSTLVILLSSSPNKNQHSDSTETTNTTDEQQYLLS
jgi:hypothetical protein